MSRPFFNSNLMANIKTIRRVEAKTSYISFLNRIYNIPCCSGPFNAPNYTTILKTLSNSWFKNQYSSQISGFVVYSCTYLKINCFHWLIWMKLEEGRINYRCYEIIAITSERRRSLEPRYIRFRLTCIVEMQFIGFADSSKRLRKHKALRTE